MRLRAKEIETWADADPESPTLLPRLVRRLLQANNPSRLESLAVRSDHGAWLGGWDGLTSGSTGSISLPRGAAGWELSTARNIQEKASDDYRDRTRQPEPLDRAKASYVALSARIWPTKIDWAAARARRREWVDVRAHDAEDLLTWLDEAPAVAVWFEQIVTGRRAFGAIDVERWWSEFSAGTRPLLPMSLVHGDRDEQATTLLTRLGQDARIHFVRGESRDEARAFLAAAILSASSEEARERFLALTLIVDDERTWRELALHNQPLVLVPNFEWSTAIAEAQHHGHHIVLTLGNQDSPERGELALGPMRPSTVSRALSTAGLPRVDAERIASQAGGSLSVVRRTLAVSRNLEHPEWAKSGAGPQLVPALLLGAWDEDVIADLEIASQAAQGEYQRFASLLRQVLWEPAGPIQRIGTVWRLVSIPDAWRKLHHWLARDDLARFERLAVQILSECDPRYDLPPEERWLAPVRGQRLRHSQHLREGIAETVAQISSISADLPRLDSSCSPEELARRIVRAVLGNAGWKLWASLGSLLSPLAEACPDGFLDALEGSLRGGQPGLSPLFVEQGGVGVSSPHVEVLWALERLAWSRSHLSRVVHLLAELDQVDPGGRLSNRPLGSLIGIFRLWLPQTGVSLADRLAVIDALRTRFPAVVWKVMLGILPHTMAIAVPAAKPNFQDWAVDDIQPSPTELSVAVNAVMDRLLVEAGSSADRWRDIVDGFNEWPEWLVDSATERVHAVDVSGWSDEEREAVHGQLRELITQHRRFPNAAWAWSAERVSRLDPLFEKTAPGDPVIRFQWLFTSHPSLSAPDPIDYERYETELAAARVHAIQEVGRDRVTALAEAVEAPWTVGLAVADVATTWKLAAGPFLSRSFTSKSTAVHQMARGFLLRGRVIHGDRWLERLLKSRATSNWPAALRVEMLVLLPFLASTWERVAADGDEVERLYWHNVSYLGLGSLDQSTIDTVALSLTRAHALGRAIDFLGLYRDGASPEVILTVLQAATSTEETDIPWASVVLDIWGLIDRLQREPRIDQDAVARLEWQLMPTVNLGQYEPRALYSKLSTDPTFFMELLEVLYRAEDEKRMERREEAGAEVASRAYLLLHGWRLPPGIDADGQAQRAPLRDWIERARSLAKASGRLRVAERHIGQVLAFLRADEDGVWPHRILRDLIEDGVSQEIEEGLQIGLLIGRGVVTKALDEGGRQERELAAQYAGYAAHVEHRWPHTAAVLRDISNDYERQARREDTATQLEFGSR